MQWVNDSYLFLTELHGLIQDGRNLEQLLDCKTIGLVERLDIELDMGLIHLYNQSEHS